MSRARDLSKLGNPNVIVADTERVGFGTQVPENAANASSSLISAGIVTATAFYGDGSNLEGVASAGLGTAVDDTKDSIGQNIYFTNAELSINANTTVNAPDSSNIAYTQYQQVTVESGSELIIADGDSFIPDVLGIGTALQASNITANGNGLFGTVFVDNIENAAGRGGPNFPLGMTVSGVSTFSGNVSIGGTLTYEDVTNVDSIGIVTARSGIKVTGGGINVTGSGIDISGISTFGRSVSGNNVAEFYTSNSTGQLSLGRALGAALNTTSYLKWTEPGAQGTGEIRFGTSAASNNPIERLRIGSAGQIGIGGANYGTSGQVLTSGGGSAAPTWAEAGGGAWEVINDVSMGADYGSHEIDITGFTTAYTKYVVNVNNLNFVGGTGKAVWVRYYIDGSLYTASTYAYHDERHEWGVAGSSNSGSYNQVAWKWCAGVSGQSWCGEVHIQMHMNATTDPNSPRATIPQGTNSGNIFESGGSAGGPAGRRITGLKIYNGTDSTNFGLSGRVTTHGLKYS